jgi:hypothetical protein
MSACQLKALTFTYPHIYPQIHKRVKSGKITDGLKEIKEASIFSSSTVNYLLEKFKTCCRRVNGYTIRQVALELDSLYI